MIKQLFLNIATKDVKKARHFFTSIGFTINEYYSNEDTICVILGEQNFMMVMSEEKFSGFTKLPTTNSKTEKEALFSLSLASKEAVDEMIKQAINAGGTWTETVDYGWMYYSVFKDLDGHHFEAFYMPEEAVQS